MENRTLSLEIISAYRGWHDLTLAEKGYDAAKLIVIDDLAPPAAPARFAAMAEVEAAFARLAHGVAPWARSDDPFLRYSHAKISQSLAYIRQSADLPGGLEGVAARGGRWMHIADEELVEMRARLDSIRTGRPAGAPDPLEFIDNSEAPRLIGENADRWLPRMGELLPGLEPVRYRIRAVDEPAPWRNMVVHEDGGFVLLVNTSAAVRYTRADAEYFALHEVCGHVVHLSMLARSREVLARAPHLLCISIHTRDAWYTEGVAQAISEFVISGEPPGSLSRAGVLAFDLSFAVIHRNVVDLLEGSVSPEGAAALHARLIPGGPDRAAFYRRISADPFYACQALVYASSRRDFAPCVDAMGAPETRDEAFRRLCENFFGFDDLKEAFGRG